LREIRNGWGGFELCAFYSTLALSMVKEIAVFVLREYPSKAQRGPRLGYALRLPIPHSLGEKMKARSKFFALAPSSLLSSGLKISR